MTRPGPVGMTPAGPVGFTAPQYRRAIELVQARLIRHVAGNEYRVTTGPAPGALTRYLVDAYRCTCTCPAGEHGRPCYHLAAAMALHAGRTAVPVAG